MIRVATAGWSIPRAGANRFPESGSGLERYAAVFHGVEVNSTFYRSHRPSTFARWAASVPDDFRFAVKTPKEITHERRLDDCAAPLAQFLASAQILGAKLGPLLIQLPPSLAFDGALANAFFTLFRAQYSGAAVCEPRHPSWFDAEADAVFRVHRISRAAADPAPTPEAARPGGFDGLAYLRLHGSPRIYYSSYAGRDLDAAAALMQESAAEEKWCVFDNTASGAALPNALDFQDRLASAVAG